MHTEVSISYNTSRPSWDRNAYRISYGTSEKTPFELRQIGPVDNGIVYYRGVYAKRAAAERVARRYVRT